MLNLKRDNEKYMEQLSLFGNKTEKHQPIINSNVQSSIQQQKNNKKFISKEEYYLSEEWETKRRFALHRAGNRCDRCGSKGPLQIHHITYDRLYDEKPEDLEVLCLKCHKKADNQRKYDSWYESAFNTYMTKKYGEDWDYFEGCEEEFDEWIESKEDEDWY